MQKIEIVALLSDSKKIIELLQRRGTVEPISCEDEDLVTMNTSSAISVFEKNRAVIESALSVIDEYAPQKESLLDSFKPKKEFEIHKFGQKAFELEKTMQQANSVVGLLKKINDTKSKISQKSVLADSMKAWQELDIKLNFKGTRSTVAFIGSVAHTLDTEDLKSKLDEKTVIQTVSENKQQKNIFVLCKRDVAQDTESVLRDNGFTELSQTYDKTPSEIVLDCQNEISALKEAIGKSVKEITELAKYREDFKFFIDYLQMRKEKYVAVGNIGVTKKTFVLKGYIPEKYSAQLVDEIEKKYTCVASLSPVDEETEDVPVLLENSGFSSPVEGITEMYALPGKKDIDPTPVMSFFYYLFFGMMLSDAGYGLLMVFGTAFALKKLHFEEKMRKTLKMFFYCGISTVFWGAMFGSWFGDIIPVVSREFFGKEIGSLALWFEPLDDPMKLLLFSFLLGILHLFLGLITNFVILFKRGEKANAVFDVIPVILTVSGAAPLAAGILTPAIPAVISKIGVYLAISGVVLIVLTAGRSSKSIPMRFFGGIYGLYNVATGYLSDILSYSRLLALGLATGSIASVINLIGVMPSNPVIKAVMLIIVFIIGHIANLAINLLGAYVHTDRLQFVELFSKFYEGGGRAFEPLKIKTNYIELKEEKVNE